MTEEVEAKESGSQPETEVVEQPEGEPKTEPVPEPKLTANGEPETRQTRNWRALERDRDHWREMAMRQQAPPPAPPAPTEPQGKTLADFDHDEAKYQQYLFTIAETRAIAAAKRELQQQAQQENQTRRVQTFKTREDDFAKKQADYYEVAHDESVPISTAMAEAIAESEEGPALAYHLGKNPDLAFRLANLSPTSAARELGRIEASLIAEREKAKAPVVSKAPPPAPKIDGVDPSLRVNPDDPDSDKAMTDAEWMRKRERQLAKRAG